MDEYITNFMGTSLEAFISNFKDIDNADDAVATISYYSMFLQNTKRFATAAIENCILNRNFNVSTDEQDLLEARQYAQAILNSLYEY